MISLSYFITPLIGGVIGYMTNDIAIKMLFRPREAKYLFGKKLPFTPGLIPKEKSRLAQSLGVSISQNLMNQEVLEKTLLSEEMLKKLTASVDEFCTQQRGNGESLLCFLSHYLPEEDITKIAESVTEELEKLITMKLTTTDLGGRISAIVMEHALQKTRDGLLGVLGADKLLKPIAGLAEPMLARQINEMLEANSASLVHEMIANQSRDFLQMPMRSFFEGHEELVEQAKASILKAYRTIVHEHLPNILSTLNISKIVEDRINEMDMAELESLIFEVMDKELKAIIWLGAGLGAIIGCVNLFF